MASLRDTAACIDVTGDFSVVRDFYGYLSKPGDLSVLTQVSLLQGRYVDLNLIRVGIESFTPADEADIDNAVQYTRDHFEPVGLGVGRILRFFVTTADANGHDHIETDGEAEALTHDWTVPNDAIDVFLVPSFHMGIGLSPIEGPCDKSGVRMNGSVVAMEGSWTTYTMARHVAMYLGLRGNYYDKENLMWNTIPNGGELTPQQGSDMRDHCFVNGGC